MSRNPNFTDAELTLLRVYEVSLDDLVQVNVERLEPLCRGQDLPGFVLNALFAFFEEAYLVLKTAMGLLAAGMPTEYIAGINLYNVNGRPLLREMLQSKGWTLLEQCLDRLRYVMLLNPNIGPQHLQQALMFEWRTYSKNPVLPLLLLEDPYFVRRIALRPSPQHGLIALLFFEAVPFKVWHTFVCDAFDEFWVPRSFFRVDGIRAIRVRHWKGENLRTALPAGVAEPEPYVFGVCEFVIYYEDSIDEEGRPVPVKVRRVISKPHLWLQQIRELQQEPAPSPLEQVTLLSSLEDQSADAPRWPPRGDNVVG